MIDGQPGERAASATSDGELKQCCARLYESDFARHLLGESFHPGGDALTLRVGELLGLGPQTRVLDVASGRGTSALLLAHRFGCQVIGVDLSQQNVDLATAEATRRGLSARVQFRVGDAENLPIADGEVDALVCECAFCTFPDKARAAGEFSRVLSPGGHVGLSDITRAAGAADEFADLMSWIACLADAMPAAAYAEWLRTGGLQTLVVEPHDEALRDLVKTIGTRLFTAEILAGLNKLDMSGVDLTAAKRLVRQSLDAVNEGRLGYAVIVAALPLA